MPLLCAHCCCTHLCRFLLHTKKAVTNKKPAPHTPAMMPTREDEPAEPLSTFCDTAPLLIGVLVAGPTDRMVTVTPALERSAE